MNTILQFLNNFKKNKDMEMPIMELWESQTYFILEELVPKDVYYDRGDKAIEIISEPALRTLIKIRELFQNPITVNNWKWEGPYNNRGYRHESYYNDDRKHYSQHQFGNAFDFDVRGFKADDARELIKGWKKNGELPYLTGLEEGEGVTWVHIDCRLTDRLNEDGLFIFNP